MKNYSFIILLSLFLLSCEQGGLKDSQILFGENNTFELQGDERETIVDSLDVVLNESIHEKIGKVQFPVNRSVVSDKYKLLINLAVPCKNKKLVIDQTNASPFILLKKKDTYLIKRDTNYIVRHFFVCPNEQYIYEFNFVSSDSSLSAKQYLACDSLVGARVECR